jgi:hypothetical protein
MRHTWLMVLALVLGIFAILASIMKPEPCMLYATCELRDDRIYFHGLLTPCMNSDTDVQYYCAWTDETECPIQVRCSTTWRYLAELAIWVSLTTALISAKIFFDLQDAKSSKKAESA